MTGSGHGPLLRLYRWVLHWAYTPYGGRALGALSFAESSFFPIPPDPLLLALALGRPKRAYVFAAIATAASVAGGVAAYLIGAAAWGATQDFFFQWVPGVTPESFDRVGGLYDRYSFWAVFLAGLTPLPYKVFTLSAGVFGINPVIFVVASALSRGLRFTVLAALIHRWGESIGGFIERRFALLTWAFGALVVLGFVVIEWVI